MKNTTNYGLKKPDGTDAVDIAIINQNMDTIDTTMKSNANQINDLKNNKANTSHGNHIPATQTANNKKFLRCDNTWQDVTPGNIGAAPASHTHDDRYYTETEINTKLNAKANTSHTHTKSQISDFPNSLPANGGNADSVGGNRFNWAERHVNPVFIWGSPDGVVGNQYVFRPSSIVAGGIQASDTRNIQYTPEWYMQNKPMSTIAEFKTTAAIGITGTGSAHCYLETHTPWNDSSGGYPMQIAWLDTRTPLYRRGINATTWGAWESLGGGGVVKSVQRGFIAADKADYIDSYYSKDYAISAVNPSKTMINLYSHNNSKPVCGRLMNATTLRVFYISTGEGNYYVRDVSWEVIEFY